MDSHESSLKLADDRFSRFCTARPYAQHTDRPADTVTTWPNNQSVFCGHIFVIVARSISVSVDHYTLRQVTFPSAIFRRLSTDSVKLLQIILL